MPHRDRQRPHIVRSPEQQDQTAASAFADTLRSQLRESSELIGRRLGQVGSAAQNFVGGLSIVNPAMETARSFKRVGKGLRGEAEPTIGDVFNVAGTLAGGGIGAARRGATEGGLGVFGGFGSARRPPARSLERAQKLEQRGASPERVSQRTGTHTGPEGLRRFEISDHGATIKGIPRKGTGELGDILDHPSLYNQYPDLENIKIEVAKTGPAAAHRPALRRPPLLDDPETIVIRSDAPSEEALKNTLLHELQHAVQHREGFQTGSNPTRARLLFEFGKIHRSLADAGAVDEARQVRSAGLKFLGRSRKQQQEIANKMYDRMAGEIEAVNVARRSDLTPRERRALPPQVTERSARGETVRSEDQILQPSPLVPPERLARGILGLFTEN